MTEKEDEHKLQNTDVQQLLVIKEKVEWSSSLDQQDPPELPHIKEEQEELWTRQEGEQLPGLEEADTRFTLSPVTVKSEEDEEELQSSQLHQIKTEEFRDGELLKTEAEGEDCGGPEPVKDSDPDSHLQPADEDKTSHSSEPETDDSWDWEDTREPRSGLKRLQNNEEPVGDVKCNVGGKPFNCTISGKRYPQRNSLNDHMKLHSQSKGFSCSVCKKMFPCSSCEHRPCFSGQMVSAPRTGTPRLTHQDRACAMGKLQAGVPQNQVAALLGVSPSTISKLKAKFRLTGDVIDRPRSGRPKKTTPQEDRFLTLSARRNRWQSSTDLQSKFAGRYGRRLSAQTIRNRLHAADLRSHRAARRPTATARHRQAR
ncbi:zinc finger and SCAN domain-containing protein 31-like [Acanthopagrus latus]|uniref:zinc finger and SCAN domain-containing protein 31-like n=1 Tax=Acanthopagrus latus TaxID=8177 RepID=UPI00187D0264|nr:zinc finger and SCAN domain-containing protein 31-like [Acanthopagrus latus]XP_036949847.1 zinc finger and SCAN domain-containing protein 31-like [Acanthopagrus latus]